MKKKMIKKRKINLSKEIIKIAEKNIHRKNYLKKKSNNKK